MIEESDAKGAIRGHDCAYQERRCCASARSSISLFPCALWLSLALGWLGQGAAEASVALPQSSSLHPRRINDIAAEPEDPDADLTVPDLNTTASHYGCGTPSPSDCEKTLMWLVDQRWKKANERRLRRRALSGKLNDKLFEIPVLFHVMAQEGPGKTIGTVDWTHRKALMNQLKDAFADTPFKFFHSKTVTVKNNKYHNCENLDEYMKGSRDGGGNALNTILCDTRKYKYWDDRNGLVSAPTIGKAAFPHWLKEGNGLASDRIVLRTPVSELMTDLPEIPGVEATNALAVYMTFVHEVGHWLGLLHTFEGGCSPKLHDAVYPNGAVGDGVRDTPAEAAPAWDSSGWKTCFQGRKKPDTCSNKKNGVDKGKDPVNNFMDYNHQVCAHQEGKFTNGQIERMQAHFETYRLGIDALEDRRRLEGTSDVAFIPDEELIGICVKSAVQDCSCDQDCFFKFRDSLRDFLPFPSFQKLDKEVKKSCSECHEINSSVGCPAGQLCKWNSTQIGNRCVESMFCWDDAKCGEGKHCTLTSGWCSAASRGDCNAQGGCQYDLHEYCDPEYNQCHWKLHDGRTCQSDESCVSGICSVHGRCSRCKGDEDCSSGEQCLGKQAGYSKYFTCQQPRSCTTTTSCPWGTYCDIGSCRPWKPVGHNCSSNDMCRNDCQDGKCTGCSSVGPLVDGRDWCGDNNNYWCGDESNPRCIKKIVDTLRCWADWQCGSGDCRHGACFGDCEQDDHCAMWADIYGTRSGRNERLQCKDRFCVRNASKIDDLALEDFYEYYDCRTGAYKERCDQCARNTEADWQCESPQYCLNGRCEAKKLEGAACQIGRACASGNCLDGKCTGEYDCVRNGDCPSHQYCSGYVCTDRQENDPFRPCTEDFECLSNACHKGYYGQYTFCAECKYDLHCLKNAPDRPYCYGRQLSWRCYECKEDKHCPSNQYCSAFDYTRARALGLWIGKCYDKECQSHSDCTSSSKPYCNSRGICDASSPAPTGTPTSRPSITNAPTPLPTETSLPTAAPVVTTSPTKAPTAAPVTEKPTTMPVTDAPTFEPSSEPEPESGHAPRSDQLDDGGGVSEDNRECILDEDCKSAELPFCVYSPFYQKNLCVACSSQEACGSDKYCDSNVYDPLSSFTCKDTCGGEQGACTDLSTPHCFYDANMEAQRCVQCRADEDCPSNHICDVLSDQPTYTCMIMIAPRAIPFSAAGEFVP